MTMHRARPFLLLFMIAAFSSSQARAEEARTLVTIGMQRLFEDVKAAYEAASGQKLDADFAATADIVKRVQEEQAADFIIVSRAGVDRLIKAGKVAEDKTFVAAQSSIALAVPAVSRVLQNAHIVELATKHKKTAVQIVLRWHLQQGLVVIPRSINPKHIAGNFDVFDFELSSTDMAAINALNVDERGGPDPETFDLATYNALVASRAKEVEIAIPSDSGSANPVPRVHA